jgi:hypothetical protein
MLSKKDSIFCVNINLTSILILKINQLYGISPETIKFILKNHNKTLSSHTQIKNS